ncbi:hypothetical protein [Nocardia cyriacigeorgica]|uniref:hypothetical protein n=1 Tax=Nocardia cyriacigeorgica TaxID=135487 RepID=UPI00267F6DF3
MPDRRKLAAVGGALLLLFGVALGIGALVGDRTEPAPDRQAAAPADHALGLTDTASGYTLSEISAPEVPVTDLDPYLGAYAHLVALRTEDLAYLHVHPQGEVGTSPPGPRVSFHA